MQDLVHYTFHIASNVTQGPKLGAINDNFTI